MHSLDKNHPSSPAPTEKKRPKQDLPVEDDRYPGSFFKVPAVPRPGKTAWRSS